MARIIQARIEIDYAAAALVTIENTDTGLEPPTYRVQLDAYAEKASVTTTFQSPIKKRMDLIAAAFIALADKARKEGLA